MTLLVIGSIAFDSIKTPVGEKKDVLGGSATFISISASHFVPVRLVGVVGDDFPKCSLDLLHSRNIDTEGLQIVPGKTFRWAGKYEGAMNEAITLETELNVFQYFNPIIPPQYRTIPWVFLGNIEPGLQRRVLEQQKSPSLVALDTMNYWINGSLQSLLMTLSRVNMLVINETEAKMLVDETSLVRACQKITKLGPTIVVAKRGEYGALLFYDNDWFHVPAYPVSNVVDPTGAGDTFAGGLMGFLAASGKITRRNLKKAVIYGSVMSSFKITDFGPYPLMKITKTDIQKRFQEFRNLTSL